MKELYLDAEVEIVKFSIADVITTSTEVSQTDSGEETMSTEEVPIEDDGPIDWGAWTVPES